MPSPRTLSDNTADIFSHQSQLRNEGRENSPKFRQTNRPFS